MALLLVAASLTPRQRPNTSRDIKEYPSTPGEQRVFSAGLAAETTRSEWEKYWNLPSVTGSFTGLLVWP